MIKLFLVVALLLPSLFSANGTYTATCYVLRGKTASGEYVRKGIIAVDPRVIPLHSKVHIRAGKYTNIYVAKDTGGKIKGRRIDIWMPKRKPCMKFGERKVTVTVLRRGKKKRRR